MKIELPTNKQLEKFALKLDNKLTENFCELTKFMIELHERLILQEQIIRHLAKNTDNQDILKLLDSINFKIHEKYN